jgi:hypothetical protein
MIAEFHTGTGETGPYLYGEFPIHTWEIFVGLGILTLIGPVVWLVVRKEQ